MTKNATTGPWSRLWDMGVLHSCANGIQGNYDGAILEFWQRQFDNLDDFSRVVDIGTGNGALLLLARESSMVRGIKLDMHGIDIADINPAQSIPDGKNRFAGIHFHPNTSACQLPFADGEVDMVCSQFGFEYVPREAAIQEIMRVVHERSRISLITHSTDSVIADVAGPQLEACAFLLHECPIIKQARAMVSILSHAAATQNTHGKASSLESENQRINFNRSAGKLADEIERLPQALVLKNAATQIRTALQTAGKSLPQAELILEQLTINLEDEQTRLRQLQSALLSDTELEALVNRLQQHGFHTRYAKLEQQPNVKIGWSIEAARGFT